MAFALTYQDYLSGKPTDDGGRPQGAFSEDQWNGLSDAQKWSNVGNGIALSSEDPRYADLAKMVGSTSGAPIFAMYGSDPGARSKDQFVDPSRVVDHDNVMFVANDNLTPKAQSDTSGLSDLGWFLAAAAIVGGGALVGGAMDAGAASAAGGAAGDESAGLALGNVGDESAGLNLGGTAAGSPPPVDTPLPVDTPPPAGPPEGGTPPPGYEAPPPNNGLPTTPDFDVPMQSPPEVQVPPPNVPSNGLINTAMNGYNNLVNSVTPQWYQNLSSPSRFLLNQVVSQGVSSGFKGAMAANAQRNAADTARETEQRHRDDIIRRGQVPVLPPNTFVPKNPGG